MKIILRLLLVAFVALVAYLLFWPTHIDAVAVDLKPDPGMTGDFAANEALKGVLHLKLARGNGPEDVTRGADGMLYTGLADGRIVRLRVDGTAPEEEFANTGGRPLGMQFDASGNLIVADAFKGLLSIAPDGTIRTLTDSVDGQKMIFVDDLDIASDGVIWFSDASRRFDLHENITDYWEGQATGRLVTYDPATGETKVRLEDLHFANGVALGPDEEFVLINETMSSRIARLWLKGPKAGQHDIFIDGLPGLPDNLSYDGQGVFWVAFVFPRSDDLDWLMPRPFLRTAVFRALELFDIAPPVPPAIGWVVGLDADGKVVRNLQGPLGGYALITSVNRFGDVLVLGSLAMDSVATIPVP